MEGLVSRPVSNFRLQPHARPRLRHQRAACRCPPRKLAPTPQGPANPLGNQLPLNPPRAARMAASCRPGRPGCRSKGRAGPPDPRADRAADSGTASLLPTTRTNPYSIGMEGRTPCPGSRSATQVPPKARARQALCSAPIGCDSRPPARQFRSGPGTLQQTSCSAVRACGFAWEASAACNQHTV